jgi:hypothetical protein
VDVKGDEDWRRFFYAYISFSFFVKTCFTTRVESFGSFPPSWLFLVGAGSHSRFTF